MRVFALMLCLIGLLLNNGLKGQGAQPRPIEANLSNETPSFIKLNRTSEKIVLDGELNEPAWRNGVAAKQFWQYFPTDTLFAEKQTEIYMAYDDEFLYVGVKCFAAGEDYIVNSLKRDYRAGGNDNISLIFDTFNDETNAFLFGMNPYGVRREALISGGGLERSGFSTSWDNKWYGEASIHNGFWVAEFAIPFKTLRFKEGGSKWRFNSYRFDTQSNERSTWMHIPRHQNIYNLAYMGEMVWEEPLKKPGTNISIIPYITTSSNQDFEAENSEADFDLMAGADAKIAITPSLNLDLTVNPDFSQVEVDEQVLDLSRFEIFFPERRQFFLENADLFGSFGSSRINPFFSRRIGVGRDTSTGQNIQNNILYGARLNGKLTDDLRLGLLNMQTAKDEANGMPSFNYTVAALQQKVFSRSNIGLIVVNKQAMKQEENNLFQNYNRIIGLDYNLASRNNNWTGKVFYHQAITPIDSLDNKLAHGVELTYKRRRYSLEWLHQYVGEGYDAEVGFVPRKDFFRINPEARLFFYPKEGFINQHGPSLELSVLYNPEIGRSDQQIDFNWEFRFKNTSRIDFVVRNEFIYLFDDFDPTRIQEDSTVLLLAGTDYNYTSFQASYNSDRRKLLSFRLAPVFGQFFNGMRYGLSGSLNFRFQPYGSISINYNYNYIKLDDPFEPVSLFLIGPRIDFTLNKKVFFTGFFQYNSQINNININARLQWRFKPVSDFFLVYTDNYGSDPFIKKNRAIVAKLTYWLNL